MESVKKMNVLVLGNSGAGKSTLIKAISGTDVQTGVGEGNTQRIDVYESATWPIRCIDTKGFEYKRFEQTKTIRQVQKFTKDQITLSRTVGDTGVDIDAVWYCVEGTSRRTFTYNIEMVNKAVKKWRNIPVFAVLTKSYSRMDVAENVEALREAFSRSPSVNLQDVIPVVAQAYVINEDTIVDPYGIDTLCNRTLDCWEDAKKISEENRERMILEQKRYTANALVVGATTTGVVIGAVPIPFADSLILVPLETMLTKSIFKVYGVDFSGDLITAIVGSTAITNVARAALSALKTIPNIAGSVVNAVVAGFFVAALGEAVVALCEAICAGLVDTDKAENAVTFVTEKLKENPTMHFVVDYFEKNALKLQGKSAKETYLAIEAAAEKECEPKQ